MIDFNSSCWFSDWLNEAFAGRRATIAISAIMIFISSVVGAFATSTGMLLASRVLLGVGMGWKASTVPVFAAEIAPAHLRGMINA
jgi:MFS family permease